MGVSKRLLIISHKIRERERTELNRIDFEIYSNLIFFSNRLLFSYFFMGGMGSCFNIECACAAVECIDHAVLMVGYDDTTEIPYFKMKNSWGTKVSYVYFEVRRRFYLFYTALVKYEYVVQRNKKK